MDCQESQIQIKIQIKNKNVLITHTIRRICSNTDDYGNPISCDTNIDCYQSNEYNYDIYIESVLI